MLSRLLSSARGGAKRVMTMPPRISVIALLSMMLYTVSSVCTLPGGGVCESFAFYSYGVKRVQYGVAARDILKVR